MSPWTTPDPPIYGGPQHPFPMNAQSRDTDALALEAVAFERECAERYAEEIGANLPTDVKRERALRLAEGCPRVDYRNML